MIGMGFKMIGMGFNMIEMGFNMIGMGFNVQGRVRRVHLGARDRVCVHSPLGIGMGIGIVQCPVYRFVFTVPCLKMRVGVSLAIRDEDRDGVQ